MRGSDREQGQIPSFKLYFKLPKYSLAIGPPTAENPCL